jgi:hypothetical protein
MHPFGGGGFVQAEEIGEDCGRELRGEVEQRGPAAALGVDADGPQAFAEPGRGDRAAGQVPGEQPGRGGRRADAAVAAPLADQLEDGAGRIDLRRAGRLLGSDALALGGVGDRRSLRRRALRLGSKVCHHQTPL